jgi:hypothetical protein
MIAHVVAKGLIVGGVIEVILVIGMFVILQIQDRTKLNRRKK